ncbi:MAG: GNAT family N-acetyltransferase [Anaerolineae bacterium]|nr:GNAT family N-acetyltransferase [Anaerolineae bacterium]
MLTDAPILESERLRLRSLLLEDAPLIYEYMRDSEIAANTLNIPYPYPEGAAEEWIQAANEANRDGKGFTFALVLKASHTFIGSIGLGVEHIHQRAEVGYWIGKAYWGQGYVTEAVRRLIAFGFDDLKLNRIHARYFDRNPASGRVMQKAGMTYEGTLRAHYLKWGDFLDAHLYAILRKDYEARRS